MKKKFRYIVIVILFFFVIYILTHSRSIVETMKFSMDLWKNNVFPTLFPFFIISDLLINYGFVEIASKLFTPLMKFFKIKKECACIFVLSLFSGFPSNSKYAKELFDKNIIDEYDVTKILLFTHFSNPLFILGTIGIFLNQKLAFLILISHYLGNFIIGIIFRNYHPSYSDSNIKIQSNISNNFIETLTSSLFKTIDTLLLLLGIISTFLIITCMISDILNINQNLQYFINGIIEMTQGIKYICSSNIDINLKAIVSTFFISLGGICIHAQVKSVLKGVNIKYKIYLLARILHAFISSTILFLLINI